MAAVSAPFRPGLGLVADRLLDALEAEIHAVCSRGDCICRQFEHPLLGIARGRHGPSAGQLVTWTDRLIVAHQPRAVVVYSGENDLAGLLGGRRKSADDLVALFAQVCDQVHARLPATRVYWVSIKKPPARREVWPEIERANEVLAQFCAGDPRLGVIDVLTPMCDPLGVPREELYGADGIHLNAAGYAVWTSIIRPRLMAESPEE